MSQGFLDAVVAWWDIYLDAEREITLSTRPVWIEGLENDKLSDTPQSWRDHWQQCWAPGTGNTVQVKEEPCTLQWCPPSRSPEEINISYKATVPKV